MNFEKILFIYLIVSVLFFLWKNRSEIDIMGVTSVIMVSILEAFFWLLIAIFFIWGANLFI